MITWNNKCYIFLNRLVVGANTSYLCGLNEITLLLLVAVEPSKEQSCALCLLTAMPDLDTADDRLYSIPGSPPNLLHEPKGDAFAPRNAFAMKIDEKAEPPLFRVSDTHYAATWLLHPDAPKITMPSELRARLERARKEAAKVL